MSYYILEEHKEIDSLRMSIHDVTLLEPTLPVIVIAISKIEGKVIHLKLHNDQFDYLIQPPNHHELIEITFNLIFI